VDESATGSANSFFSSTRSAGHEVRRLALRP
jgi:hypothetical protein